MIVQTSIIKPLQYLRLFPHNLVIYVLFHLKLIAIINGHDPCRTIDKKQPRCH